MKAKELTAKVPSPFGPKTKYYGCKFKVESEIYSLISADYDEVNNEMILRVDQDGESFNIYVNADAEIEILN